MHETEVNETAKKWIDNASYESLLRIWRMAPVGDPMFQGATGEYYSDVMFKKKAELGNAGAVRASKNVGW